MSTPDPKTVRDFARRAILSSAEDVDYCGIGEQFGDEEAWPNEEAAYGAMLDAVYAEQQKATVTVSWADEQQPADVVTAEQQQDGAAGDRGSVRAASLLAFLDLHRERRGHDVIASLAVGDGRTVELTQVQLSAVLAERTALAAQVAELKSEREVGVRAVESMLRAMTGTERYAAAQELYHCFADRIEAPTATEIEES